MIKKSLGCESHRPVGLGGGIAGERSVDSHQDVRAGGVHVALGRPVLRDGLVAGQHLLLALGELAVRNDLLERADLTGLLALDGDFAAVILEDRGVDALVGDSFHHEDILPNTSHT
jgi:hypothetical protein